MDKKKILLTILLAGILALIAVLFLCSPKKQTPFTVEKENVVKEQVFDEETEIQESIEEKVQEEAKPKAVSVVKKVSPKKFVPQKPKQRPQAPKPSVNINHTEDATPEVENVSVIQDENGVVVLNEFKSQNSYKYTYTPVRYKSK